MNKIRVIDLLNKIAKGEEVPEKIKVNDIEFEIYTESPIIDYQLANGQSTYLFQDYIHCFGEINFNDPIKIIEEEKEIEELSWQQIGYKKINGTFEGVRDIKDIVIDVNKQIDNLGKKINELVRELNKIKKEGK